MGAKVDTTGIEFLEGDFGVGRSPKAKVAKKPVKPAVRVAKPDPFQGIHSYRLVRELIVRHYKFVLSTLFWIGVGAVIVILGR